MIKLVASGENQYGKWKRFQNVTTNGDRIRAMSDEVLAEWLTMVEVRIIECNPMLERPAMKADWLDWLKQEVDT